jgi:hypothetical protein
VGRDEITHDGALTMREIIEPVTDAYAAFNRRDIDRALSVMHSMYARLSNPFGSVAVGDATERKNAAGILDERQRSWLTPRANAQVRGGPRTSPFGLQPSTAYPVSSWTHPRDRCRRRRSTLRAP